MQISQIYITDDPIGLPPFLQMATNTVSSLIPHTKHKIYSNNELRQLILEVMGSRFLESYDKLIPYAYKADFARYILLYHFGGWYFDISIRVINGIKVGSDVDFITFTDLPQYSQTSYACSNGIIYSKANNIILEKAIEIVMKNIHTEYYGKNALYPTGPIPLGKAVSLYEQNLRVITGSFMELTPGFKNRNRGFVFNDGTILALHKPGNHAGDLSNTGATGTNNYQTLYAQKNIYKTIN